MRRSRSSPGASAAASSATARLLGLVGLVRPCTSAMRGSLAASRNSGMTGLGASVPDLGFPAEPCYPPPPTQKRAVDSGADDRTGARLASPLNDAQGRPRPGAAELAMAVNPTAVASARRSPSTTCCCSRACRDVLPSEVDIRTRITRDDPPQHPDHRLGDGHRDRGHDGDRHGAGRRHRRHPPQSRARASRPRRCAR